MAMAGVARRFAFFDVEFGVVVTAGENLSSGETTNPHFVRGLDLTRGDTPELSSDLLFNLTEC